MSLPQPSTPAKGLPPGIERGKKYRFHVKSAEEAIEVIRSRLGEEARVLSVRQVEGQGLSRFLSAPKLEIIARIPLLGEGPDDARPAPPAPALNSAPAVDEKGGSGGRQGSEKTQFRLPEEAPQEPASTHSGNQDAGYTRPRRLAEAAFANPSNLSREASPQDPPDNLDETLRANLDAPPQANPAAQARPGQFRPETDANGPATRSDLWTLLGKAGFADNLVQSLRFTQDADRLSAMPIPHALAEISQRLRTLYNHLEPVALTRRIAFLGTPGVGKTTALCKRLAQEVFIQRRQVQVLKIDGENPNPDDGLSVFCEVLGVPLLRDPVDREDLPETDLLYLDLPGSGLAETSGWAQLKRRLDSLDVRTRVLVAHACYESSMIAASFELGTRMGATHVVFTHIDELPNVTKLWPFLLHGGLSPFFLSLGQNVTSDYSPAILDEFLSRTFPAGLLR